MNEVKFNPNDHLMNLKGKQYLQVMWRLVWFREEKPKWCIDTKLEQLTADHAVFSAKISDETGTQKASGYGSESIKDFRDYIEKAETKAIGRALAMLGYGTQFAPELDEGDRIVDSPAQKLTDVERKMPPVQFVCEECGEVLKPYISPKTGKQVGIREHAEAVRKVCGKVMCRSCYEKYYPQK